MTYQALRDFIKLIPLGKVSIEDLKDAYAKAVDSKDALKTEITSLYKVADLKRKFYYARSLKKADLVDDYYQQLLGSFRITEGLFSYSFGESYSEALKKAINQQTQEELDKYVKSQQQKREAFQKALTNPQTIEEFKRFIIYKGEGALTSEQNAQYEALIADRTLEAQQKQQQVKAAVKAVSLEEVDFTIQQTTHTKKGHDLWVVQLSQRVDKDKYQELNRKAKQLGGYYSSYAKAGAIPGFQFKTEEAANQFMSLKEGDVSRAESIEQKQADKKLTVSERFYQMADSWEEQGKEKLNADRKTNTARRARMASSVEADAETKIYLAKVLRNIAKGLEKDEIKYLSRIDSAVQLDVLRNIIYRAYYSRMRKEDIPYNQWEADFDKDIEYVTYPYPGYHWERLRKLSYQLEKIRGQKMRARRIYQAAINTSAKKGQWQVIFKRSSILDIRAAIEVIKDRSDKEWLKNQLEDYDRIQRMGLTNLATLKTALREYNRYSNISALSPEEEQAKRIKQLERQFVGKKIPGFFPTPRPLVIRMLELADIDSDDTILEPSAGLGHIADIIAEKHPDNELLVIEDYPTLAEALQTKGYQVQKEDFLQYQQKRFDKIIMNPPFEKLQDIDHVRHAYDRLKAGGRLVAIMAANKGEGAQRKKVVEFREWLDSIGAYMEENPEGAFKSAFRSTGVRTITVAIDKAAGQEAPPIDVPKSSAKPEAAKAPDQEPWQMRLKDYVYLRGNGYSLGEKYYTDFIENVSHWGGAWPVDKRTGATWSVDKNVTLRYIKEHRKSVQEALDEGKLVPKAVLQDQMMEANPIIWMNLSDIHVDENRFQNRASLNPTIVDEIAQNFDPNQFDPIVIWKDPKDGKIYLLAGHHRLAGVKKAGKARISARWFQGSQQQAITYAKELSNANRTLETPLERANIYRQKLTSQEPKKVQAQVKKLEGKNWRYILNLAYLNPDGKTVNALIALIDNSDKNTQQNLEKIADWTGEARRQFSSLTNTHENEMYDFLLDNFKAAKPSINRKDLWVERIRAIVQTLDFKNTEPLNLKRIQYKTQGESQYESQMREIDTQIKAAEQKKKELAERFNKPTHPNYVSPDQADYDQLQKQADKQVKKLNEQLKALRKQKLELAQQKGKMVKGGLAQMDLFSAAVKKIEKEVDEIRLRQDRPEGKPENKAKTSSNLADTYEQAFTEKDYIQIVRNKLDRARKDKVKIAEAEIIQLGIMIRPLVQSYQGALIDITSTNKRVLAPTLNNLLRWAQKPGRYDLIGVDIASGVQPTVLAKQVKKARILNLLGLK